MEFVAKTFAGLEEVLAIELKEIGARDIEPARRAVKFTGDTATLYRANYKLRTALKILVPIASFNARNQDELYDNILKIEWTNYMNHDQTFSIETILFSDNFNNSNFVSLKAKDGIVDYFRNKTGKRPNVNTDNPDISLSLYLSKDQCTVSLDSSGEPLFKRNYRQFSLIAPINEVLAAAMIKMSDWDWSSPFVDPMCGSGTILIEAAMIAMGIPPGFMREKFCFMNWPNFNTKMWDKVKEEALSKRSTFCPKIVGADISREAVKVARQNILNAGLQDHITVQLMPLDEYIPPAGGGVMITNPPYGERINDTNMPALYKNIGDNLKKKFEGYNAWIISSNDAAIKSIGLHHSKSISLYNGPLECKYRMFSIYTGTKRQRDEF